MCICNLMQAARQYNKKAWEILKKVMFTRGNVDHVLNGEKQERIAYVALYIDDNLFVGNPEAIDEIVELLWTNSFLLKIVDRLQNYLSCKINFSKKKTKHGHDNSNCLKVWKKEVATGKNLSKGNLKRKLFGFKIIDSQVCKKDNKVNMYMD